MWKPGKPMSQSYESAPNQWMGLSFFVLDRDGQHDTRPHGQPGGISLVPLLRSGDEGRVIAVFNTTNYVAPASAAFRKMQDDALALLR